MLVIPRNSNWLSYYKTYKMEPSLTPLRKNSHQILPPQKDKDIKVQMGTTQITHFSPHHQKHQTHKEGSRSRWFLVNPTFPIGKTPLFHHQDPKSPRNFQSLSQRGLSWRQLPSPSWWWLQVRSRQQESWDMSHQVPNLLQEPILRGEETVLVHLDRVRSLNMTREEEVWISILQRDTMGRQELWGRSVLKWWGILEAILSLMDLGTMPEDKPPSRLWGSEDSSKESSTDLGRTRFTTKNILKLLNF